MRTRPKLYWYLVCAFVPRLSWERLLWVFYELKAPARDPLRAWLQARMRQRFRSYLAPYCADFGSDVRIGRGLILRHGFNGLHIADTAVIGDNCELLQFVTIGANVTGDEQAPVIGNNVFIGAGAQVIGRCRIGDGARIGANVTLVNVDIPAGAVIVDRSAYDLTNRRYLYPQG